MILPQEAPAEESKDVAEPEAADAEVAEAAPASGCFQPKKLIKTGVLIKRQQRDR